MLTKKTRSTSLKVALSYCLLASSSLVSTQTNAFVYDDDSNALLGSTRGGNPQWDFCEGKSDDTPLPVDPRTIVKPGINAGRAVHFNTFWAECHVDPVAVGEPGHPETCGELRERSAKGYDLLDTGGPQASALFSGSQYNSAEALGGIATFSSKAFNNLWKRWGGFTERPENFDYLVAQRYGSGFGSERNPYPLPGEDPNKTNGGSGQLPEMFTQLRRKDGSWSGRIAPTCHGCHSGEIGEASEGKDLGFVYGGTSATDLNLLLRDMLPLGYAASGVTPLNLTQTRGTTNASDVNLAFLFPEKGLPTARGIWSVLISGSTGSMDAPMWWNMGHRPAKFVDGIFPMDAARVDAVFYTPIAGILGGVGGKLTDKGENWMRQHGPEINTWVETLKAPAYPMEINQPLAEAGAVLFHELDLWAPARNNPIKRPEGNGSCASCHGAYAPRYVNNTDYLENPILEGMAGYIVPLDIIGTDPERVLSFNDGLQNAGAKNFFGYPQTEGQDEDCGPQNQPRLRGDREIGYLAPPLYGVWASAPYFHNGSVPNVMGVLKPEYRPKMWRRVSTPMPEGSNPEKPPVMGYDVNLGRAYDEVRMGWDFDTIPCERHFPTVVPGMNCAVGDEDKDPAALKLMSRLFSNVVITWNLFYPPIMNNEQVENRKIYNTHLFTHGNEGHEFTGVLSDQEAAAIIEYLKTL